MGAHKYSGIDKAAILLMGLGHELAAEIVKHFTPDEVKRIGAAMQRLRAVDQDTYEAILKEFSASLQKPRPRTVGMTPEFAKIFPGVNGTHLEAVELVDGETLAKIISREHPQTIALVLAHLDPQKCAETLKALPQPMHADLLMRVANLESVSPEEIEALDQHLREEIASLNRFGKKKVGGVEKVASILNAVDRATESAILSQIAERHPDLSSDIKNRMFVFDDLARIEPRAMQELIKAVPQKLWTLALRTASDGVKNLVFQNMSQRGAQMLREDMEAMGKVKVADVTTAQRDILAAAKKLEADGKITLTVGLDEYV